MRLFPIYAWNKGIRNIKVTKNNFVNQPWAQGLILILCVIIAMLLANLDSTKDIYRSILHANVHINIHTHGGDDFIFPHNMTVERIINDILMVVFFFVVGLEIKKEIAHGALSSIKEALLPIIAAVGGVVLPALIYLSVNAGTPAACGWGIPTATDIAFAVAILTVLGNRVPVSLKIFLTALAIADDLIAILIVAIFYGGTVDLSLLGLALIVVCLVLIMKNLGEKRAWMYFLPAIIIWILFYYSGIHATMSGVVMAFLIPMEARYKKKHFYRLRKALRMRMDDFEKEHEVEGFPNSGQRKCLRRMSSIAMNSIDLSSRLEHALSPWVNFLIIPVFALANAGVEINDISYFNVFKYDSVLGGVSPGIFFGLVIGKPVGIWLASFIAIKSKLGLMPEGGTWKKLFAVACLGGIGFTMSIFVDTLSFPVSDDVSARLHNMGKISILSASVFSALTGSFLLMLFDKKKS